MHGARLAALAESATPSSLEAAVAGGIRSSRRCAKGWSATAWRASTASGTVPATILTTMRETPGLTSCWPRRRRRAMPRPIPARRRRHRRRAQAGTDGAAFAPRSIPPASMSRHPPRHPMTSSSPKSRLSHQAARAGARPGTARATCIPAWSRSRRRRPYRRRVQCRGDRGRLSARPCSRPRRRAGADRLRGGGRHRRRGARAHAGLVVPAARLADKKTSPSGSPCRGLLYAPDGAGPAGRDRAAVSGVLAKERISLESMLQRGRSQSGEVPVVLTTHETEEARMRRALARIAKLKAVAEEPCLIRI